MQLPSRRIVLGALFAALAFGLVACGGRETPTAAPPTEPPTPTATPAPTATPTPAPLKPITVNPTTDPTGFLNQLPTSERDCLNQKLGPNGFTSMVQQNSEPSSDQIAALKACLSSNTMARLFVGGMATQAHVELSTATLECMNGHLQGADLASLFTKTGSSSAISSSTVRAVLPALFCLNQQERTALEQGQGGGGIGNVGSISALECLYNTLGPDKLAGVIGGGLSGSSTTSPELMGALLNCGSMLPPQASTSSSESPAGPVGTSTPASNVGTAVFQACLTSRIPPADLAALANPAATTTPSTDALVAAFECVLKSNNMNLAASGMTDAEVRCVVSAIGPDRIAAMIRGQGMVDPSMMQALVGCESNLTATSSSK